MYWCGFYRSQCIQSGRHVAAHPVLTLNYVFTFAFPLMYWCAFYPSHRMHFMQRSSRACAYLFLCFCRSQRKRSVNVCVCVLSCEREVFCMYVQACIYVLERVESVLHAATVAHFDLCSDVPFIVRSAYRICVSRKRM